MRVFKSRCSLGCIPLGIHSNKVVVSITYPYLDGLCHRLCLGKGGLLVLLRKLGNQGVYRLRRHAKRAP